MRKRSLTRQQRLRRRSMLIQQAAFILVLIFCLVFPGVVEAVLG